MKEKKVTRLLEQITKAREILESKDVNKIGANLYLFQTIEETVKRQAKKYIESETHELDFNSEDLRILSDLLFDTINRMQRLSYNQLYKRLTQKLPITIEDFNALCYVVKDPMFYDKFFRPIANSLSWWAIVIWLWSESEYKKDIMEQITDHLRSFL